MRQAVQLQDGSFLRLRVCGLYDGRTRLRRVAPGRRSVLATYLRRVHDGVGGPDCSRGL